MYLYIYMYIDIQCSNVSKCCITYDTFLLLSLRLGKCLRAKLGTCRGQKSVRKENMTDRNMVTLGCIIRNVVHPFTPFAAEIP